MIKLKGFKRLLTIVLIMVGMLIINSRASWAEENDDLVKEAIAGFSLAPELFNPEILDKYSDYMKEVIVGFSLMSESFNVGIFYLDSLPISVKIARKKRNWLKASLETIGANVVVWAFDRYILTLDCMSTSFSDISNNFKSGFGWDAGYFVGNQFAHPYHGGIYFTTGRLNGFTFWESSIFSFFGSLVWEMTGETSRPSMNDLIMTTLGGMPLGEIIFRFSDLIIHEDATGMRRITQEILVLFINPAISFDRFITGKMFRIGNEIGNHYYNLATLFGPTNFGLMVGIDLEYKDVFKEGESRIKPYDYFRFELRTGFDVVMRLGKQRLISSGILFGKRIKVVLDNDSLIGLFANFDFIDIPGNKISALGVGPGLFTGFDLSSGFFMNAFASFSGIFGGSTSSFVLKHGKEIFTRHGETHQFGPENDPYYLGLGTLGKLELELGKEKYGSIYAGIYHHWLHSILATNAEESVTRLHFRIGFDTGKRSQIRLEYGLYLRRGTYRDYPLLRKQDHVLSVFYVLKF